MVTKTEMFVLEHKQLDEIFYTILNLWARWVKLNDRERMNDCNKILAQYNVSPEEMLRYYQKAIQMNID